MLKRPKRRLRKWGLILGIPILIFVTPLIVNQFYPLPFLNQNNEKGPKAQKTHNFSFSKPEIVTLPEGFIPYFWEEYTYAANFVKENTFYRMKLETNDIENFDYKKLKIVWDISLDKDISPDRNTSKDWEYETSIQSNLWESDGYVYFMDRTKYWLNHNIGKTATVTPKAIYYENTARPMDFAKTYKYTYTGEPVSGNYHSSGWELVSSTV